MTPIIRVGTVLAAAAALTAGSLYAVPVNSGGTPTIADRKNFIPNRKQLPLPGKVVGVLVSDPQPALSAEGRSGPADQMCLGYAGGSYRWIYVPVEKNPMIRWLDLPVGQGAEKKRFNSLSLASPATVKNFGVTSRYALVEVEVNDGLGSPADDSFAATKMKQLDGTKEFPLKVEEVIADVSRRYQDYLKENSRDIDAGMEKAAVAAIKNKRATGPRERVDLMFVTWLPETQRLRIHFRSTLTDGLYDYEGGIRIDTGGMRTMALRPGLRPGIATASRAPMGLRQGTQFGIEIGMAFEVSKSGKVERTLTLPIEPFQREVKGPGIFPRGVGYSTSRKAILPR